MTIEECRLAAYYRTPVICNGIAYDRIVRIVAITEYPGSRPPETSFRVVLKNRGENSQTEAVPERVRLVHESIDRLIWEINEEERK